MIFLKWTVISLVLLLILHKAYQFAVLISTLKQGDVLFPQDAEEAKAIHVLIGKSVQPPTISGQKSGIYLYVFILIFTLGMLIAGILSMLNWSFFLLILVPFINGSDVLNVFAITNRGVLYRNRFIPWKHVKSYEFIPIDMNHRFYGYTKEINDGYELRIETKGWSKVRVAITAEEMDRLENRLKQCAS